MLRSLKIPIEDTIIFSTILLLTYVAPIIEFSPIMTNLWIPAIFLYYAFKNNFYFYYYKGAFKFLVFFFFWSVFTSLFAEYSEIAFFTEKKLLLVFMYMFVLYHYAKGSIDKVKIIYLAHVVTLCLMLVDVNFFSAVPNGDELERLGSDGEGLNANTYSYYIFTGCCSLFFLIGLAAKKISKMHLIYIICGGLACLSVLFSAASRGGLLIFLFIVGTFFFILYNKRVKSKMMMALRVVFVLGIVGSFVMFFVVSSFKETLMFNRFDSLNEKEDIRGVLIEDGLRIGFENPFFGVGGGNFSQFNSFHKGVFSHSSYSESFANYGFMGLALFTIPFLLLLVKAKRLLITSQNRVPLQMIVICLLAYLIYHFLYVTYLSTHFMGLFVAIIIHLEIEEQLVKAEIDKNRMY